MAFDVQIRGLVKRYRDVTAVDGLDLVVREGEMLGLIGPDGAGKTTTLRILCGLIRSDAGECRVAGKHPRRDMMAVRSIVGYMPQRFSLYPDLTVAENLRFFADLFQVGASERERRLKRLLQFSRLGSFAGRRASALSGGMKQKLALSCALIHTPKVLFLDEPTTGVDPVSRREFWDILRDLRGQGVTLLVTTPYMDEAAKCDRVVLMHRGRTLHASEPDTLPSLFRNTLLEVVCEKRAAAVRVLEGVEGIDAAQAFGDRLHVSGKGTAGSLIRRARQVLGDAGIPVQSAVQIRPGIEDVFVELLRDEGSP
jgi:ABC-2 type transport system ATP-binding protein